jgi:galactoside O-acetyltransferase
MKQLLIKRRLFIIINEICEWLECILLRYIPGHIGIVLRYGYWKLRLKHASYFSIYPGCLITAPNNISIGKRAAISRNCFLYAHNNGEIQIGDKVSLNTNVQVGAADNGLILIGNNVSVGPNVVIRASNHRFDNNNVIIQAQGHEGGMIIIENDV